MNNKKLSSELAVFANQKNKEREYWLNKLSGEWLKSYFPYDYKKTPGRSELDMGPLPRIEEEAFSITGELFSGITKLSRGIDHALHTIAAAGISLLLSIYTGYEDIIIGVPVYRQTFEGAFINTVLILRNRLDAEMTFKDLLLQMKQTIETAVENQNYPVEILPDQLGIPVSAHEDFPLFDVSILLENIHDKKYILPIKHNVMFSLKREQDTLEGAAAYNSSLYHKKTIRRIISHFIAILTQVRDNVNIKIPDIEILSDVEKKQLLYEFNAAETGYPDSKTMAELFEEQVERTPGNIVFCSPIDYRDFFIPSSSFKKNPYLHESDLRFYQSPGNTGDEIHLKLLKTPYHNSVVVNRNMGKFIDLFDGERSIEAIFSFLTRQAAKDIKLIIYSKETGDLLEITHDFHRRADIFSNMDLVDCISLVRLLFTHHIIEPAAVMRYRAGFKQIESEDYFSAEESFDGKIALADLLNPLKNGPMNPTAADVLLLGDTPGMPTSGLLYLASYLKRNGVNAICRFYDGAEDYDTMKQDIEKLLENIRPGIAAVSMKWFPYISRVKDTCKIIRDYARKAGVPIKIVVGGNTASFYWENIIADENIDYVIRGDGELPLLKICRGENDADIPNCVYKTNGEIHQTPFSFVKDASNSAEIYLSHLDEILLLDKISRFGTFFIYTHLGCGMNCFYCGGCNQAQQEAFNREGVFIRPVTEVRKDIIAALPFTSTFHFDFDIYHEDLVEYCRKIWSGIDLSGYFCLLNSLKPPSAALIELAAKTFKYVYWDLDVLTLSERHRKQLFSMGIVKPQLTDNEILTVLDHCDAFKNVEVRINLINGLPHLEPGDIGRAEKFLDIVMSRSRSFSELHWARLHAQPGAPILGDAEKYNMHSFAVSYEDFLEYSKKNFNSQSLHRGLEHLNYPYIYFNDESLNSKLSLHFSETDKKIYKYKESIQANRAPVETITYEQCNNRADELALELKARGLAPGNIAAIMLTATINIPLAILAVWKVGATYLPIDPESPAGRISYMLNDSGAKILLTTPTAQAKIKVDMLEQSVKILDIDKLISTSTSTSTSTSASTSNSSLVSSANVAYVIYTSGTTGKPKGALLTHKNLVNYVAWFKKKAGLTHQDKTLLVSSFAFDLGYTALYPPMLAGGECHILPRDIYLSPERLLNYIDQKGITYIKTTPSLFKPIVNNPGFLAIKCKTLRLAVIGGESIDLDDVETAHSLCGRLEILNHYGPTEAAVGCIARYIDFTCFAEYRMSPSIGKPIDNAGVYIVDKNLHLLPIGVPGELCISGVGLSIGYLNQPALTAEKFKKYRSYRSNRTYILYKTGDLAKWLPDGNIQFLGRIDKQVKIRGYRVELEEIKNRLLKHRQIKDATVTVREDGKGDKYLCAYIVPRETGMALKNKMLTLKEVEEKEKWPAPVDEAADSQRSIIGLFETLVEKFPDKVIDELKDKTWTYAALDRYTNQVAHLVRENYDDRYRLSKSERVRYKRQMLLYGWGQAFQEKLKSTTVFVAGAGGGGSPTIIQLALLGFGNIIVCDYDTIELSNLNRQFLHDHERLGMNKALSTKLTVNRVNPHVNVIPIDRKLTRENVFELVGDAAIIFDMFDGPADKFILSECAVVKQIPHVIISMADINAYTAVFQTPKTPCYHCIFSKEKLEAITAGMKTYVENYSKNPLAVSATSLFVSTGTAINEALKILLASEEPAYNKFFYFNQRGVNRNLRYTHSYRSMTHLFSDHFQAICTGQGFDWDVGWRGNFLEVLDMVPDPGCPLCGEKGKEKRSALELEMKKQSAGLKGAFVTNLPNQELQTVALLKANDAAADVAALLGILKAGKAYVPLTPTLPDDRLYKILEESEARVIVTDSINRGRAEKLRDMVNKAIPVVDVSVPAEAAGRENPGTPGEANDIAYLLFPPDSTAAPTKERECAMQTQGDVLRFLRRFRYHSRYNAHDPNPAVRFPYEYELKTPMLELLGSLLYPEIPFTPGNDREMSNYSLSQLKEYLSDELPEYMIPAYFVRLEKLPLTPNGKIDLKALPEPELGLPVEKYTVPANKTEEKLVLIWSELLGIEKEKIGVSHNFFELGGNSLNLILLVSKIYKEFGVQLPITQIFDNPVIREIAASLTAKDFADRPVMLLNRLKPKKLFLFPPQIAYGVFYLGLGAIINEYSFYAFNFIEEEDRIEKYIDIMKGLQPGGPFVMFGYSAAGRLIFEITGALEKLGFEVSDIIFLDCVYYENQPLVIEDEFMAEHYKFIEEFLGYMGVPFLKEQVIEKSGKYIKYCQDTPPLKTVNAVIHLILSEEARRTENPHCWDNLTSKAVVTYDGFGEHLDVFKPGILERNAAVIKKIMDQIASRTSLSFPV